MCRDLVFSLFLHSFYQKARMLMLSVRNQNRRIVLEETLCEMVVVSLVPCCLGTTNNGWLRGAQRIKGSAAQRVACAMNMVADFRRRAAWCMHETTLLGMVV